MPNGSGVSPTLCFSTLGCGELDLEQVFDLARRNRVPAVELRTLSGGNELPDYFDRRYGTPERLAQAVTQSGVRIASIDSSAQAIESKQTDRNELLALAPWAVAAGAPAIRIFDGGERGDEAELSSAAALFDWWAASGPAVALMVETHDALAQPAALRRFIARFPRASVLWDTHHTWHEGGEAPSVTWSAIQGRTHHLHVKDSIAGGSYVPPGEGRFPFGDLIGALNASSFSGTVSLEWERHWFPNLPPLDTVLPGFLDLFGRGQGPSRGTSGKESRSGD